MERQEGMQYIASLSYGKDSIAMLHVITDILHWPLDRIITADVWATDTIPADFPPVAKFKEEADKIIKERWGISVEHFHALESDGKTKKTFEGYFYKKCLSSKHPEWVGKMNGWPLGFGSSWCNGELKRGAFNIMRKTTNGAFEYVGIALDEEVRIKKHARKKNVLMPLVEAKWTEQMCFDWCKANGLLSPSYSDRKRDGCWFCINQNVENLRQVKHKYPDLWQMLLKWDADAIEDEGRGKRFKKSGLTVHDFDRRFKWEDAGYEPNGKQFRWDDLNDSQMNIFQFIGEKEGE